MNLSTDILCFIRRTLIVLEKNAEAVQEALAPDCVCFLPPQAPLKAGAPQWAHHTALPDAADRGCGLLLRAGRGETK